ncbi:MAG: sulfatase [bacterium]|nr:sulfatase [bacterium]
MTGLFRKIKKYFKKKLRNRNSSEENLRNFKKVSDNLNILSREEKLSSIPDVEIKGKSQKSKRKVFVYGQEDIYLSKNKKVLSVILTVPENASYLEFYYGFIKVPKKQMGTVFSAEIECKDKEVFKRELTPNAFLETRKKKQNKESFSWSKGRISLKHYCGEKVRLRFKLTAAEETLQKKVIFGWTNIRIIKEMKIVRTKKDNKKPNMILILCDALRHDKLFTELTPFLNSIKKETRLISPVYSVSSWTWPAVASLLTGLYPEKHNVQRIDKHFISDSAKTIGEVLQENNYITLGLSSNPLINEKYHFNRGFDTFKSFNDFSELDSFLPFLKDWLKFFKDYNFFSYIHTMETHDPYTPKSAFIKKVKANKKKYDPKTHLELIRKYNLHSQLPDDPKYIKNIESLYDAEVMTFDENLKNLYKILGETGILSDTVICVLADHGEEFMEHGKIGHGYNLSEILLKIPVLFIGRIPEIRKKSLYSVMDVFPSIMDLTGVETEAVDGISFLDEREHSLLYFSTFNYASSDGNMYAKFAVMKGSLKLIYFPKEEKWELFDLEKDPDEKIDLFPDQLYSTRVDELKNILLKYYDTEKQKDKKEKLDRKLEKTLKGLGYI